MCALLRWFIVSAIVLTGLSAFAVSEKKIDRSELPAAVQKSVDVEQQGATIRGFSQETNGKETFYEVELVRNGHSKDVLMDSSGQVVEVEEELLIESLPAAIQQRLHAEIGDGRIEKLESITKRDKLTGYEAQVVKNGARSEIKFSAEGQRLKR